MSRVPSQRSFEAECYRLMKAIPRGKVTTYKLLAKAIGSNAPRAVGNACRKNPHAPQVPCHRVVKSDGSIGGYAFGVAKKVALLKREGVSFEGPRKVDLKRHLFRF